MGTNRSNRIARVGKNISKYGKKGFPPFDFGRVRVVRHFEQISFIWDLLTGEHLFFELAFNYSQNH